METPDATEVLYAAAMSRQHAGCLVRVEPDHRPTCPVVAGQVIGRVIVGLAVPNARRAGASLERAHVVRLGDHVGLGEQRIEELQPPRRAARALFRPRPRCVAHHDCGRRVDRIRQRLSIRRDGRELDDPVVCERRQIDVVPHDLRPVAGFPATEPLRVPNVFHDIDRRA